MPCWCQRLEEASQTSSRWWEGKGNSNKHSLQLQRGKKKNKNKKNISQCPTHPVLKQYNNRRLQGAITVSYKEETEVTLSTGSPQVDKRRLENHCLIRWVNNFCCNIWMIQSESCENNLEAQIHWWFRLVRIWGIFSCHTSPRYQCIVTYNFHVFKVTVYSSSDSGHKAKFILNLFLAHDSEFTALKRPNKQQISNL